MKVPLLDLQAQYAPIRAEVRAVMDRVCDAQHFILGPEVSVLEEEVAELCGAAFGVGGSSGTDALLAAMMAVGVGPGDEVITSSFTFLPPPELSCVWVRVLCSSISMLKLSI